jgi:hypothetical protein
LGDEYVQVNGIMQTVARGKDDGRSTQTLKQRGCTLERIAMTTGHGDCNCGSRIILIPFVLWQYDIQGWDIDRALG